MLLQCLRKIADCGCSILISIHHPSVPMFQTMDRIMVLHRGRCFFQCNTSAVHQYFEDRGIPVPEGENPADWMLTISQTKTVQDLEARGFFSAPTITCGELQVPLDATNIQGEGLNNFGVHQMIQEQPKSICTEMKLLLLREGQGLIRDTGLLIRRACLSLFGGTLLSVVYYGVADDEIGSPEDLSSHVGLIFFTLLISCVVSPPIILESIDNRPMLSREMRTGTYCILSFAVVNFLRDILVTLYMGVLYFVPVFWSVGFQGRFWYLFFVLITTPVSIISLSILLTSLSRDSKNAKVIAGTESMLFVFFV